VQTKPRQKFARILGFVTLVIAATFTAPAADVHAQATVYTVNSTAITSDGACDATNCTLREAITAANGHPNGAATDEIHFNITSGCSISTGVCTIAPETALPTITDPVLIDGYTQTGASPSTHPTTSNAVLRIELDGQYADEGTNGLTITASDSTVRGLVINGFTNHGVHITGSGANRNTVRGCYIGTNAAGTGARRNEQKGIVIDAAASNNTIGGAEASARNVISGNGAAGIYIEGSTTTQNNVLGNLIGTNAGGTASLGNGRSGVALNSATWNTIGGTTAQARNVISGNLEYGINIDGGISGNNTVQGNYIGANAAGTAALGNDSGVRISASTENTIGGSAAGAGNLISGNTEYGIYIYNAKNPGNTVQGNYIGVNASGAAALGNGSDGVYIFAAAANLIGGTTAQARNVISGNLGDGVEISSTATDNRVQGNYIGVNASNTAAVGNGENGILVYGPQNTIGGTDAGAGNLIAYNGADGVVITGTASPGNPIQGNAIFSNSALGIDLGNNGVTPNDTGDGDSTNDGSSRLQNFPVLATVTASALSGALNSTASTAFRLEFFASAGCDPSGYGEGAQYLGAQAVTTNAGGNATFSFAYTPPAGKPYFTATATNTTTGDTSEFSFCKALAPTVNLTAQPTSSTYGSSVTLTATVTSGDPDNPYPPGAVQFKDGSTNLGAPVTLNASGQAQYTTSSLTAGSHTLAAQYLGGGVYPSAEDTLAYTVGKKALTVTGISAANKVYDGTTTAALNTGSAALVGVVSGDTVSLVTSGASGAFADKNVGQNKPVTVSGLALSGADAGNYTVTPPTLTASITQRTLTITADNKSKVYGQAVPALTVTYSNFAPGDTPAVLTSPPALTTTAAPTSPVGTYPITITPGSPAAQNYTFTLVAGTLTVNKASTGLQITASTTTPAFAQPVTLTATVTVQVPGSGTASGTVTFTEGATVLGTAALSPNGSGGAAAVFTISVLSPGAHNLTATYGGSANFNGSTGSRKITVGQGKPVYLPLLSKTQ